MAHAHHHDHDHSHDSHSHGGDGHDHGRDHAHGHAGHSHAPSTFGFAFAVGVTLNAGFVLAELFFGYFANSLALISDALHNFADVIALLLAWGAAVLSRKLPTELHTYGYRGASILAALANAGLLLLGVGAIVVAAIDRLRAPAEVTGSTVIWAAALGILINGATALLFMRGSEHDLNIRGAYLHMAADAAVSCGVVVAAVVIMLTGWLWVDPVTSLIVATLVLVSGWGLARDSVNLALDAVPRHVDFVEVRDYLAALEGVADVHDLHIWAMSTSETALTVHLVRPGGFDDLFLHGVCEQLSQRFRIQHTTLQVEASRETCRLAPADVV